MFHICVWGMDSVVTLFRFLYHTDSTIAAMDFSFLFLLKRVSREIVMMSTCSVTIFIEPTATSGRTRLFCGLLRSWLYLCHCTERILARTS